MPKVTQQSTANPRLDSGVIGVSVPSDSLWAPLPLVRQLFGLRSRHSTGQTTGAVVSRGNSWGPSLKLAVTGRSEPAAGQQCPHASPPRPPSPEQFSRSRRPKPPFTRSGLVGGERPFPSHWVSHAAPLMGCRITFTSFQHPREADCMILSISQVRTPRPSVGECPVRAQGSSVPFREGAPPPPPTPKWAQVPPRVQPPLPRPA